MSPGSRRLSCAAGALFALTPVVSFLLSGEVRAQPNSFPAEIIAPEPPIDCVKEYSALNAEALRRHQLFKAAADRHAQPGEACTLIGSFRQSIAKMIKYLEVHAAECSTLTNFAEQLRSNHSQTEATEIKICTVARERHAPSDPTGDFWPSSVALPPQGLSTPANPKDIWMTPQELKIR